MNIEIGKRYNKLTVLCDDGTRTKRGKIKWRCLCDCGNITYGIGYKITRGLKKSCGCLQGEEARVKHVHYSRAESIVNRCGSPNNHFYKIYSGKNKLGDRTWEVCKALDKVPGYFIGAQIDRIDNSGDYTLDHPKYGRDIYTDESGRPCIGNLRWVTQQENLMNTSRNVTMESLKTLPRQKSNIIRALHRRNLIEDNFEFTHVCDDNLGNKLYIIYQK